jgi:hypothetical protein
MNMNMKKIKPMNLLLLGVLAVCIYMAMSKKNGSGGYKGKGNWTVYGTMGCGWTRKQLDHMKDKSIPHKFVDCDKNDCGNMKAFPTMKDPNGKTITGYSLIA